MQQRAVMKEQRADSRKLRVVCALSKSNRIRGIVPKYKLRHMTEDKQELFET
jgi:hypothetical protein